MTLTSSAGSGWLIIGSAGFTRVISRQTDTVRKPQQAKPNSLMQWRHSQSHSAGTRSSVQSMARQLGRAI